eukprot:CAMPEP_0176398808 /NCGR_PEP_ID=MMETSP0126-20121128/46215_1 /TAXON_ID=141414 ORGANISM="Strombidinopsis acuminatum, Strain SPMC142" /NCGR_SAMPLE_ID=MMETSP0126 /ASSEMBLY_ACC=CAM_ASM_000229 /LENGTH=46 /DNA_ID= /DNA_START= /DNA_END= /DNA_ORIENTATION=
MTAGTSVILREIVTLPTYGAVCDLSHKLKLEISSSGIDGVSGSASF